ncbi:MAG: hypothetical protein KJ906_00970 [Nanoarchaeota archaeon]|nr:hypothetical protein [Nanoarchaeota archaeon]
MDKYPSLNKVKELYEKYEKREITSSEFCQEYKNIPREHMGGVEKYIDYLIELREIVLDPGLMDEILGIDRTKSCMPRRPRDNMPILTPDVRRRWEEALEKLA